MALSAYDDPRNLYAYEQQRQLQRAMEEQRLRMQMDPRTMLGIGAAGQITQGVAAVCAPKQAEPNKVLLLLPPVA